MNSLQPVKTFVNKNILKNIWGKGKKSKKCSDLFIVRDKDLLQEISDSKDGSRE